MKPARPHPFKRPSQGRERRPAATLPTETDAPVAYKPIAELAHLIRTRQLSPVDLTDLYLRRIGEYDGTLKSYITVTPEVAQRQAQEAERLVMAGGELGREASIQGEDEENEARRDGDDAKLLGVTRRDGDEEQRHKERHGDGCEEDVS